MNPYFFMRPYFLALILLSASLSGCLEDFDRKGIIIDCEKVGVQNATSSSYEKRECEMLDYEDQDYNRSKKPNKTGTEERQKDEDSPSNSENGENATRE